jgi:hypothetical protein
VSLTAQESSGQADFASRMASPCCSTHPLTVKVEAGGAAAAVERRVQRIAVDADTD